MTHEAMSDSSVIASLTKELCLHGGRLKRILLPIFWKRSTEQIEQILKDEPKKFPVVGDLVLARSSVRICPKYLKNEREEKCDKLHLCKEYMLGKCKSLHCIFSHDISSDYNQLVLKVNEISGLNIEEIKVLLLQNDNMMLPEVCWGYMNFLCVRVTDCPFLHICEYFARGECNRTFCVRSHNLLSLGADRCQMSEISVQNFQILCELKHNENLKMLLESDKMNHEKRNLTAICNRSGGRKRKNFEDGPQRKWPAIQQVSAGMPAGPSTSYTFLFQQELNTTPVTTAGPARAPPVNVPKIGPTVSQIKSVPSPLQLVDLPNDLPMALNRLSRLVDFPSPSVPLEKPVTTFSTSPLVQQPFATILKRNTPPAAGPFTAPSSPHSRLTNFPTKDSSVPVKTPVTTSITSPFSPQPIGPSFSIPRLCVSQPEPAFPPVTIRTPANAVMNCPSVSQAKSVSYPVPVVNIPTMASTRPCRLVDSLSKSPSVQIEKPETTYTASPSTPQSMFTFMESSTCPKARTSKVPSSSYTTLVNSLKKGPSCHLEKPTITSIASLSNPKPVGPSFSIPRLSFIQPKPTTPPMTITGSANAPQVNAPLNGPSDSQAKSMSYPVPVVKVPPVLNTRQRRLVDSLDKDPSVPLKKPVTTSITSPSIHQPPVFTFMYPKTPTAASLSTAPSSCIGFNNSLTKGPSVPLEKPVTTLITSPSIHQPPVFTFMYPKTPTAASLSTAPSSCIGFNNSLTKGPSVPLEKPVTTLITSPSIRQPPVFTFMYPKTPTAASLSTAPSSCIGFNNSLTKGPSVPLENRVESIVRSQTSVPPVYTIPAFSPANPNRVPEICLSNLWKYCDLGNDCPDMHYYLPYRWQIYRGTTWEDVPNMEEVEKCYCDPKVDSIPPIDFLTMRSGGHRVRRLSTASSVMKPSEYVLTTEWLWYWRDEYGTWTQYGHSIVNHMSITISSSDLENMYLADANDVIPFEAGIHSYEISFQDMKQKNVLFKTERDVRRRPKYLNFDDVKLLKGSTRSAAAKSPLKLGTPSLKIGTSPLKLVTPPLKSGTSSMNTDIYPNIWDPESMPELGCKKVLVSRTSIEFSEIVSIFSKTVSGHEVKRMWRLQNPSLWQVFQWQKKQMEKVNQGQDVNEIRLFHGTDGKHSDAICDQNFDWRICGTHGTVYGEGSYFARDASYSHNYSTPTSGGSRAMFVARVLVGDYVNGGFQMKRPPLRPGSSTRYYDSCVDNAISPSIFVVFEKHQIYPEYLLEYEEEPKIS
ncbi:zinc finger CCCH-type antiviral protein 1-like [Phyllobates terribilis]|uniref:zinc finger CCCH-type antiviral protein 1-like n=1 Tax=Phyllobates terribilis TaxID=111132 RepID=UPI003CCB6910